MSSAHRPTWEPARAKADLSHISQVQSKHAAPTQTRLKFRKPGDTQKRSVQELKDQLVAGEKRAFAERNPDKEIIETPEEKKVKLVSWNEDADDDELSVPHQEGLKEDKTEIRAESRGDNHAEEQDEQDEAEDDEEDEDEDEDDTEALLRELEKVKQERREQQARLEQTANAKEQLTREEEIARGNPLLNLEQAIHGRMSHTPSISTQQARWDDDLIFRNQASNTGNDLSKRGFVNDLTRTSNAMLTLRHRISQKVYECMSCQANEAALYQIDAVSVL